MRVLATLSSEPVSAEGGVPVYSIPGGTELARAAPGRKQVQILLADWIRRDGRRHLLAFLQSQGKRQSQLGLEGEHLGLMITEGCRGLAATI